MIKYINIKTFVILMVFISACNETILDKTPLDSYSDATVWSDVNLASTYLNGCYNSSVIGEYNNNQGIGSVSDETFAFQGPYVTPYNVGRMSADNTIMAAAYGDNWFQTTNWGQFRNVQRINIFLDNIDNVVSVYPESQKASIKQKTDILKGEALFLRAFVYTQLCRTYGGLPIMKKANNLNNDFSLIKRSTFEETVNFIAEDCDAAAVLLPLKSAQELGRATKEAALSIKSRILLFAASDLTADGKAVNELVGYKNPNRTALWTAAKNAARAVMDLGTCQLADFGAPDQKVVAEKYWEFFSRSYTLANNEIIFGKQFQQDKGSANTVNLFQGPNGNNNFGWNNPYHSWVEGYQMKDGSEYTDHYITDNNGYIKNISTKFHHESPYYDREPRFYGSILHDSAVFQPRFSNNADRDPIGIYDRRTRRTIAADGRITDIYGIDTRQADIFPAGGNTGGYLTKKFLDPNIHGMTERNLNVWIEIRYAEILLNYAEACLELNEIGEATKYINVIRNRVALPNFEGDITKALRYERKIELYSEGFRWYDIRRWRIMPEVFVNCNSGVVITESYDVATGKRETTWQKVALNESNIFVDKMNWIPIQTDEIKRAPQLVQNPGY